jgi:hypothetical protein
MVRGLDDGSCGLKTGNYLQPIDHESLLNYVLLKRIILDQPGHTIFGADSTVKANPCPLEIPKAEV